MSFSNPIRRATSRTLQSSRFSSYCAMEILTWMMNWCVEMEVNARKSLLSLLPLTKNRAAISEMRRGEPMFSATYRMTSGRCPNPHLRDFLKKVP